ncbi:MULTISPECIES: flagellar biosynthesis repressor FlbT [unclassified Sphingomonas]|uniref:flagellar biosynthesis repressor FlbT n=1 Tax=unclassified Sphingomonas TaxID=196159 RepID=UPI000289D654|nr:MULTISPECIES: flagellar biosynthesis repressor FlbT [unclassified Sphingomonas]
MALKIWLRDGEKVVVNGAVLVALGRTRLAIENHAAVLRESEIMGPDEANTPARRLYFAAMMAYVEESARERYQDQVVLLLHALLGAIEADEAKALCVAFARHIAAGDFYRALGICRELIAYEAVALARDPAAVAERVEATH